MQGYYPLFTAIPLGMAFFNLLAAKINQKISDFLAFLAMASLSVMAVKMLFEAPFAYHVGGWAPPFGILLISDGLSSMLLVIINVIGLLAMIYSTKYMDSYTAKEKYYTLFLLMIAGMNGVVITGDLFNLYVFLEIASIASYALVGFGCEKNELEASFKYLILGGVASTLILFGIAFLYSLTGTLNMPDVAIELGKIGMNKGVGFVMALFIAGFGLKASSVPFHAWLPDAHPSAPAPISAMLSGVLIKALGVYSIARLMFHIFGPSALVSSIIMFLGALSMVVGVFLAVGQHDFKRMLAYHSISQMGYVTLGIGLGLNPNVSPALAALALFGGLFHMVNHAVFKSCLFLCSGAFEYRTGTRDKLKMGGLVRKMPVTSATCSIASLSISGVPPFNGFWSKLIIIFAFLKAGYTIYGVLAIFVAFMTMISFIRLQMNVLFGELPKRFEKIKEAPFLMTLPLVVLAILCLAIGIAYPFIDSVMLEAAKDTLLDQAAFLSFIAGV
ncbi:MAG: monovalent cation/H+ antiporter subunit D family protein [Candidatus Krumholzibacteriota bacterium]|nr:monovalent cation/H+ antiporter subunit D family protein [Candidatus Krumholzibacteriota bacterium]